MSEIKNIIFDLGGVILNLDIPKTIAEFNNLSSKPFESIYTQLQQSTIFDLFDKGQMSETDFFNELKKSLNDTVTKTEMISAWNAMLLDFPIHRFNMLIHLKSRYRLFLLSNTNEIHIKQLEEDLFKQHGHENLELFFEKVYYSCRIGMRKPDSEIFEYVLQQNHLKAHETIFFDDSPQHIQGALKTGIKAHIVPKEKDIEALLMELKLL